jgi:hypothetical protein
MKTLLPLVLVTVLSGSGSDTANDVWTHGVHIHAPAGWAHSLDGTTVVFDAPEKQASMRINTFEKDKVSDSQACIDQLIDKLSGGKQAEKDTYAAGAIDGQPSATQVTYDEGRKHKLRRIIGCNGKNYFLIDWAELSSAGSKYEKEFTRLLTGIKYELPPADKNAGTK